MNKSFKITANNTLNIELSESDINLANVAKSSGTKHHVISNNKTYNTEIIASNFDKKEYKVKVNNNTYNININNSLDDLIKQMGFEIGAAKKIDSIKAPMPGLILEVNVTTGQEVNEDDALLILEAMKMENVINSPRDGVIKSVSVVKGEAVEKNQLLIEFE